MTSAAYPDACSHCRLVTGRHLCTVDPAICPYRRTLLASRAGPPPPPPERPQRSPVHVDELIAYLEQIPNKRALVEVDHEWGAPFHVVRFDEVPGGQTVKVVIGDGRFR